LVLPSIFAHKVKSPSETLQSFLQDLVLLRAGIQLEPDSSLHILIRLISKSAQIFYHLGRIFAIGNAELAHYASKVRCFLQLVEGNTEGFDEYSPYGQETGMLQDVSVT
jgi:hypothetical protein